MENFTAQEAFEKSKKIKNSKFFIAKIEAIKLIKEAAEKGLFDCCIKIHDNDEDELQNFIIEELKSMGYEVTSNNTCYHDFHGPHPIIRLHVSWEHLNKELK